MFQTTHSPVMIVMHVPNKPRIQHRSHLRTPHPWLPLGLIGFASGLGGLIPARAIAVPPPASDEMGLSFALAPVDATESSPQSDAPVTLVEDFVPTHPLFVQGSNSLVARAIGAAEGTRTLNGDYTWAYYGHRDPGNGAWNLGTFSYQHGAETPEEADRRQLARLQRQAIELQQQADARNLRLSLEEELNGLDLANQAPAAALSASGYIDRLWESHQAGLRGADAILHARVQSYRDPTTQEWNAPGLGNSLESIAADQERRMEAIAHAIAAQPLTDVETGLSQLPDGEAWTPLAASRSSERDRPTSQGAIDELAF